MFVTLWSQSSHVLKRNENEDTDKKCDSQEKVPQKMLDPKDGGNDSDSEIEFGGEDAFEDH